MTTEQPAPTPGRWWRRRAAVVAFAVVLVALAAPLTYAARYQPLTEGSVTGVPDSTHTENAAGEGAYRIAYRDRTMAYALLSVRNTGRWPVTVERVGWPREGEDWHGLVEFRPDANRLNEPNVYGYTAAAPAFRPFELRPGEERGVAVAFWLDNCEHNAPRLMSTVTDVPVRFRAFGMADTQRIALRDPWTVVAPAAGRCPRAAADRP